MSLSDKMVQYDPHQNGYFEQDVKEFIQKIKKDRVEHCNYLGMSGDEMMIVISVKEFDELAGDKLSQ